MTIIYILKVAYVFLFACLYPSSAHNFSQIGRKLGMVTPWDPAGDMGYVRLCYALMGQRGKKIFFLCVLEHFQSIKTHFFFRKFSSTVRDVSKGSRGT